MSALTELKLLRSIKTGKGLVKLINSVKQNRRISKLKNVNRTTLSKINREKVFAKTDGNCHICDIKLDINNFQADHVKSHIMDGSSVENNFLPSCPTCNNYRWHLSSEEMQIILKVGVWAKTKIAGDPKFRLEMANRFVTYEMGVMERRRKKRD